jgi:uncharacterized protein (DUF1778 family)
MSAPKRSKSDTKAESTTIELSERDLRAFEEALLNPPEPNDVLRQAVAAYLGR